jgi:hypothetical protein
LNRHLKAGLFLDELPDIEEIERSLRRKNVARVHLEFVFQFRQVGIQLVFGDSFTTIELIDTPQDLPVDGIPVFQKPSVLFLLSLQQTQQHFFDAGRAGRSKLLLDSGLQCRIMDFDVHGSILRAAFQDGLQDGNGFPIHRS